MIWKKTNVTISKIEIRSKTKTKVEYYILLQFVYFTILWFLHVFF